MSKSGNSDGSGNDPCKTRRERPGLLRGNQGKAQTIQVAGFHRRLASTSLFLSPLSFFSALSLSHSLFRHSSPSSSISTLTSDTFSPRAFAFFIASVSFQAFRTVYKVEALNWKPRLCRRYCGFSFPPFRFRPVCSPLVAFFSILRLHLCPFFCSRSVGGPLLLHRAAKARLDVARTGRRYS